MYRTHCTVPSVPYPPYRTVPTVPTVPYTVPTVPTVPYHRTQRTAPFTVPSFLRTVPPHRALLLKFDKIEISSVTMVYTSSFSGNLPLCKLGANLFLVSYTKSLGFIPPCQRIVRRGDMRGVFKPKVLVNTQPQVYG